MFGLALDHSYASLDLLETKLVVPLAADVRDEVVRYVGDTLIAAAGGGRWHGNQVVDIPRMRGREFLPSNAVTRAGWESTLPGTLRDEVEKWDPRIRRAILKNLDVDPAGKRAAIRADLAACGADPGPLDATLASLDTIGPLLCKLANDPDRRRRTVWNTCGFIAELVHATAPGVKFLCVEGPSYSSFGAIHYAGTYVSTVLEALVRSPDGEPLSKMVAEMLGDSAYRGDTEPDAKPAATATLEPILAKRAKPKGKPKTQTSLALLEAAEAAKAGGDLRGAIEHALAAWRPTRDRFIGDAIDTLTREALAIFNGPIAHRKDKFHAAWLELAGSDDVVAHGWCAVYRGTKLPGWREREARDRAIDKLEPDPRFAIGSDEEGVLAIRDWDRIDWGDDRVRELVESASKKPAKLAPIPKAKPVSLAERGRWLAISGRPDPAKEEQRAALLAAIYAAPDDDQAREVYADQLIESGDPRGRFIAMQLAIARGTAQRTDELVDLGRTYGRRWAAPLGDIAASITFERGFPSVVRLGGSWRVEDWEAYVDAPAWSTVEKIESGDLKCEQRAIVLRSPNLGALAHIDLDGDPILELLEAEPRASLRSLDVHRWKGGTKALEKQFPARVLPLLVRMPHVTKITLWHGQVDALFASPAGAQIRELVSRWGEVAVWNRLPSSVIAYACTTSSGAVRIVREKASLLVQCIGEVDGRLLAAALALPGVARVEVPFESSVEDVKAVMAKVGATIEVVVVEDHVEQARVHA